MLLLRSAGAGDAESRPAPDARRSAMALRTGVGSAIRTAAGGTTASLAGATASSAGAAASSGGAGLALFLPLLVGRRCLIASRSGVGSIGFGAAAAGAVSIGLWLAWTAASAAAAWLCSAGLLSLRCSSASSPPPEAAGVVERGLAGDLILVLLGALAAMALRSGVGILRRTGASAGASVVEARSSKSGAAFAAIGDGLASRPLTASRRALIALRISRSTGVRPTGVRPVEARLDARAEPGVFAFSCARGGGRG